MKCPVEGCGEDHAPEFKALPPRLAGFPHFLAFKGVLGRPMGAADPRLPTRAGAVPAEGMSPKHRASCMSALLVPFVEMDFLGHEPGTGRWTTVEHKDVWEVSARQIQDYIDRRFPRDRCQRHVPGKCTRCCLPHHLSAYNKTCESFRKMGEWLALEEKAYGKPVWSVEKLVAVYAVTRRRKYAGRPPEINPVESSLAFREWLLVEASSPVQDQESKPLYEKAVSLYKDLGNAKAVAKELGLPYPTVYGWLTGRSRGGSGFGVRGAMPREYGWQLWFLQELGGRYEDLVHAEYPPQGPSVKYDAKAGLLTITGKGRLGGKSRTVPLTEDQTRGFEELLAYRGRLGELLRTWTGRDPEPVLFLTLHDSPAKSGRRLDEAPGAWNRAMRTWAARSNVWLEEQGRGAEKLDLALVSSHKIGRATSITKLAKENVPEKVLMEIRGIADHATLERYVRPTSEETRELLEAAEKSRLARKAANGNGSVSPVDAIEAVITSLDASVRGLVEPMLRGAQETIRRVLATGSGGGA